MEMWLEGLRVAVQPMNMLYLVGGTIFGLIIGALPGLGPMFAVTLALPLTFGIPAATAPILITLALMMGPAEYFMIAILALSLLSIASEGQNIKGAILGAFG